MSFAVSRLVSNLWPQRRNTNVMRTPFTRGSQYESVKRHEMPRNSTYLRVPFQVLCSQQNSKQQELPPGNKRSPPRKAATATPHPIRGVSKCMQSSRVLASARAEDTSKRFPPTTETPPPFSPHRNAEQPFAAGFPTRFLQRDLAVQHTLQLPGCPVVPFYPFVGGGCPY